MTVYETRRYYTDGHGSHADATIKVSLPPVPGVTRASDRAETAPTLPTIRERTPKRLRGAALAASDARKLDELAARICNYRSAMMPAVTVAMEGGAG